MTEQLFQIGIKGLIRNEEGKILLIHTRAWGGSPEYWDIPGGRMDPGESFLQTLQRELQEEIGASYEGEPKHLMTVQSHLTIPVGDARIPLVLVAYEVMLPKNANISLGADHPGEGVDWFTPQAAAEWLSNKYPPEFCAMVAGLTAA
jgi:8-oxo-dGTP pyrophosphatase MutT (NUDIX family)